LPTPARARTTVMVHGIWYMVYGIWFMVYGIWYMVYGIRFMVYGVRFMVTVYGQGFMVKGLGNMVRVGVYGLRVQTDLVAYFTAPVVHGFEFRVYVLTLVGYGLGL